MSAFSLTAQSALFKTKFGKLSENAYNSANPILGTIKKQYDFTGEDYKAAVPTFFAGGVGSGSLPTANPASAVKATLLAKRVYATTEIEREALKASASDEGAFVEAMKWNVQKTVEAWNRNASRIMFGDGTGALGTVQANATGSAAAPVVIITDATWVEGHWEENDYVNFGTDASVFEVETVVPSTRAVTLTRLSGTLDLTASGSGMVAYMQNSKDNDPIGLKGVCDAVAGDTLYGVTVARRFQATQIAAASSGISTDIMNELVSKVMFKTGKAPKLLVTSYVQMRKIKNFLEDQKIYQIDPRATELKGKISWSGIEYLANGSKLAIIEDRMCPDDRMYALNTDFITAYHRPDFGWFDDDGTVFLRQSTSDAYGARYGGYYQNYIIPSFQGVVTGLAK
jgi:hypothetical protein